MKQRLKQPSHRMSLRGRFLPAAIFLQKNRIASPPARNDKTWLLLLLLVFLCGVRLDAQENVGAWPSVETGPVLSQSVSVNVKAKASERAAAAPQKFATAAAFSTAGFPGNQVGPRISRAEQPVSSFRQTGGAPVPASWTPSFLISTPEVIPYPRKAVRRGWEGRVVLAYEVLPDGSVGRVEFTQSSGHALLDEVARDAVTKWKFQPALKNGKPIRDIVETPVTFKLEGRLQ